MDIPETVYREKYFMNGRDEALYLARQFDSARQLVKELKCCSNLAKEDSSVNAISLEPVFRALSMVHARQVSKLFKFAKTGIEAGNFYFDQLLKVFGSSLEARICIQGVSYVRGALRYDMLSKHPGIQYREVWEDLYVDATLNAVLAFNAAGLCLCYDLLGAVIDEEMNLVKKIDQKNKGE